MNAILAITPPVGGARTQQRRPRPVTNTILLTLGAAGAGFGMSLGLQYLADLTDVVMPGSWRQGLSGAAALISLVYALAVPSGVSLPVPQSLWRIPRNPQLSAQAYAMYFGSSIGVGFLTATPFVGTHLMLLGCLVVASPVAAAMTMIAFGISRGAPAIMAGVTLRLESGTGERDASSLAQAYARSAESLVALRLAALLLGAVFFARIALAQS